MVKVLEKISDHIFNGVVKDGKDTQLCTYSGTMVNVLNPCADQIAVGDIAHSLANLCRFNGQCSSFYSVAQHSCLGSDFALKWFKDKELAKEFLMHDATEAYVGDMIRPLKVHDPIFAEIEDGMWGAISAAFNLPREMSVECKQIDDIMATWEKRDLLPNSGVWPNLPNIDLFNLPQLKTWGPDKGRNEFLKRFAKLFF